MCLQGCGCLYEASFNSLIYRAYFTCDWQLTLSATNFLAGCVCIVAREGWWLWMVGKAWKGPDVSWDTEESSITRVGVASIQVKNRSPGDFRIETGSAGSSDASDEVDSLLAIALRNFVRNDVKRKQTMIVLAFLHYWVHFVGKLPEGLLGG
jgi:hypothetical protein